MLWINLLKNRFIIISYDLCIIPFAWLGAFWLQYNLGQIPEITIKLALNMLPIIFVSQAISFWLFGLYRGIWKFASFLDLIRVIKSIIIGESIGLLISFIAATRLEGFPRSVIILHGLLILVLWGLPRAGFRWFNDYKDLKNKGKKILIVGAGTSGENLLRSLYRSDNKQFIPVALIDDNPKKLGNEIHGIRVMGQCKDIPNIISNHYADLIIIAIPSATTNEMCKIISYCDGLNTPIRIFPGIKNIVSGEITANVLKTVSLEYLLGKEQLSSDWEQIKDHITNKTVLISGAGGSIGAELCRQIASLKPEVLVMVENSEYNLFKITEELMQESYKCKFFKYLVDIVDEPMMERIFRSHNINIVFHAASYKQIPLLENRVRSAVRNNIVGTYIMAKLATQYNVERFILISSNKAVNPTNVMGATNRVAEITCQIENIHSTTKFIIVRFGNVLDAVGSVLHIIKEQLENGEPITVTHPEISRFFIAIPEACQLILQSAAIGNGGDILVLDMGKPIKIRVLVEQMIRLSGKKIGEDIQIKYIGLRVGEKLHEELFYQDEKLLKTSHKKIFQASSKISDVNYLIEKIYNMKRAVENCDEYLLRILLIEVIPSLLRSTIHHQKSLRPVNIFNIPTTLTKEKNNIETNY